MAYRNSQLRTVENVAELRQNVSTGSAVAIIFQIIVVVLVVVTTSLAAGTA